MSARAFIQRANTCFNVVIEALHITLRSAQAPSNQPYSRALASRSYDAGHSLGILANTSFWSCAVDLAYTNETATGIGVVNITHWDDTTRDHPTNVVNFTDT